MASEGQTILLGEAMDQIVDHRGRTPKKLGGDFADTGVPVISAKNIRNGRLVLDDVRCVDEHLAKRWMPQPLQPGDVLLTSEAPLGEAAYLKNHAHYVMGQRLFALRPNPEIFHPRYLYYLMRWKAVRQSVEERATGTTAQGIRQSELRRVRLPIAPLPHQRAIAEVLGALDDKIELNLENARTADQVCEAAYDQLLGRVDGDGWARYPVAEVVTLKGGGTPSTKEPSYWEGGGYCWATPKDLAGQELPVLLDTSRHITDAGVSKISSGLLPTGTVLLSSRAPVGYTAIVDRPTAVNQGFIAMICDKELPNLYILRWAQKNVEAFRQRAGGTTFQEISKRIFRSFDVPVPPAKDLEWFTQLLEPLHELMTSRLRENLVLTQLRDALLPKLLSGELRIADAERVPEDVA